MENKNINVDILLEEKRQSIFLARQFHHDSFTRTAFDNLFFIKIMI